MVSFQSSRIFVLNKFALFEDLIQIQKRICLMPKVGQFCDLSMMMLIMVTHDIFKESRKDESLVQCSFLERNFGLSHREISSLMV